MKLKTTFLFLFFIFPIFSWAGGSCPSEQDLRKLKALQQEQLQLKSSQNKTLDQLQKEYDQVIAKLAIYQGINDMKEKYIDFKRKVSNWGDDIKNAPNDQDLGEVVEFLTENQTNMQKMVLLEDLLEQMIEASPTQRQNFENPRDFFRFFKDQCSKETYSFYNSGICQETREENSRDNSINEPLQQMFEGFALAYGKTSTEENKGHQYLKDYLETLNDNSPYFERILQSDLDRTSNTRAQLNQRLQQSVANLGDTRPNRLNEYYQCMAFKSNLADSHRCSSSFLPKVPIQNGEGLQILNRYIAEHERKNENFHKALAEKIENSSSPKFKDLKRELENKLKNIDDHLKKKQDGVLTLATPILREMGCAPLFNSDLTLSEGNFLNCLQKIDEDEIEDKTKDLKSLRDNLKRQISSIVEDDDGPYAQIEFLKKLFVEDIQADCEAPQQSLIRCAGTSIDGTPAPTILANQVGEILAEVDTQILGKGISISDVCQRREDMGGQTAELQRKYCQQPERIRGSRNPEREREEDEDLRRRANRNRNRTLERRRRRYSSFYDSETGRMRYTRRRSSVSRALPKVLEQGAGVLGTYLTVRKPDSYFEELRDDAINQKQYNHSLSQAEIAFGFNGSGGIAFPQTFTNGLSGTPGSTTFFQSQNLFFNPFLFQNSLGFQNQGFSPFFQQGIQGPFLQPRRF